MTDDVAECPDGGRCHHLCKKGNCFRVGFCGPFSGVYPNDEWPKEFSFSHQDHEDHMEKLQKEYAVTLLKG